MPRSGWGEGCLSSLPEVWVGKWGEGKAQEKKGLSEGPRAGALKDLTQVGQARSAATWSVQVGACGPS